MQGKMGKTEKNQKENHATKVTKITKTKSRKYGMNETKIEYLNTYSADLPNQPKYLGFKKKKTRIGCP